MRILQQAGKQRPVLTFVVLSYTITWAGTLPFVLLWTFVTNREIVPWMFVFLPLVYGPTIAAIIMTRVLEGRQAVRSLLQKYKTWNVGYKWYLFVILLPLFTVLAAMGIVAGMTRGTFGPVEFLPILTTFFVGPLAALPFGPLPEELGWRGYALPRLLQRHNPLVASLITGTIWTFWHGPIFFFPGATFPSVFALSPWILLVYWVGTMADSIIYTYVLSRTRGSVLMAILLHTLTNSATTILFAGLPAITDEQLCLIYLVTEALIVLVGLGMAVVLNRTPATAKSLHLHSEPVNTA
jgi:membrane protease YdiL (CAAX protease family)